ncbi:polymerase [Spirochaetia bacterium]|nr:polymerase [Spirochaetia bacterium]
MVDFVQLQQLMKEQLDQDRTIKTVDANGSTLEAAVAEAATLLDLPIRRIQYEIVDKGSPGFMGTGKKEWRIRAYERVFIDSDTLDDLYEGPAPEYVLPLVEDKDGDVFVQLTPEGDVFLKVTRPVGEGQFVDDEQAFYALENRDVKIFDRELVHNAVKAAEGDYVRVGEYQRLPGNDSVATVEILDQEMKAAIVVTAPRLGGSDIPVEEYQKLLKSQGIVFGINEEFLSDFADRPVYDESVVVAEGALAVDGRDAYIKYNFDEDQTKVHLREGSNGQVDFKELNIIQNVVANQPLAKKILAENGVNGHTVTGKGFPAKEGRDRDLPLGKNVHLAEDGVTIIADMSGQVILSGGKINVEPVYTVSGGVNLKTGNIIFLGTVIINGNVEPGFSVKASGNIEISGTVEKAELDAEGDIIVHQGITGKSDGVIRSGRSIWARFIENAQVEAGNMVVASDGIINSRVDAFKRIICQGKRAHIVGGKLRASEEINASVLGSPTSGTETICEVGVDPKSKKRLEALNIQRTDTEKQMDETQRNIQTLINIKKQRKSLPEDKEASLQELMESRNMLMTDLAKINEDMANVQAYINGLKSVGKVSASSKVYPGVKVYIKDACEIVKTDYKAVTFVIENGLVRVKKYEEPDEEATRGPDGYTTD